MANQKSKTKNLPLDLRMVDHPRGMWIHDGDRPILFWYAAAFVADIVCFGRDADVTRPPPDLPRVFDMTSYSNMHAMLRWHGPDGAYLPDKVEQHWTPRDDGGLQFEMLGTHDNGDHTRHTFEIGWNEEQREYRYEFSADFWYREHRPMEFLNFYPRGACPSQAAGRRYTHTVWRGLDGKWNSFPHNGVYTCTVVGPCRVKYLSRDEGQIGFGANAGFNPMLTVLEATPAMELHTCSMWRDEHFVVMPGGLENRENGWYHTSARVRLQSLAEPVHHGERGAGFHHGGGARTIRVSKFYHRRGERLRGVCARGCAGASCILGARGEVSSRLVGGGKGAQREALSRHQREFHRSNRGERPPGRCASPAGNRENMPADRLGGHDGLSR